MNSRSASSALRRLGEHGAASDFPGETFRVLREKETKQFGRYRTRRLVLQAQVRL